MFSHSRRQEKSGTRKRFGIVRRFSDDDRGVTAIEYTFVIGPFLLFLFMILENGMSMWGQQLLDDRLTEHSRLIKTGQAQGVISQDQFKETVCETVGLVLRDCEDSLLIDIQTFADPSEIDFSVPLDDDGNLDVAAGGYSIGGRQEYVVVRAYYEYDRVVDQFWLPFGGHISIFPSGSQLLSAAIAFRNEPF